MDHWINGELILLDTETDDPDPQEAHLIQAALIRLRGGKRLVEREWLCQPRRPIPDEAVRVHKITTERAQAEGRSVDEVLAELAVELEAWDTANVLIGANVNYDLTVLDRELGRAFGTGLTVYGPVVDTLICERRCDRFRPGSRQLSDQCSHYGIELGSDAHDAFADALAAGRLMFKIVYRCLNGGWPRGQYGPHATEREARRLIAGADAAQLHRLQIGWHEEAQRGLAEYWRGPKAAEKARERVRRGELTEQEARDWIESRPAAADQVEALAVGCWPVIPRDRAATQRDSLVVVPVPE